MLHTICLFNILYKDRCCSRLFFCKEETMHAQSEGWSHRLWPQCLWGHPIHMHGLIITTSWRNLSDRFRSDESCHNFRCSYENDSKTRIFFQVGKKTQYWIPFQVFDPQTDFSCCILLKDDWTIYVSIKLHFRTNLHYQYMCIFQQLFDQLIQLKTWQPGIRKFPWY